MIDLIAELFSYDFILRAVVVGLMVSLCAALLGISLVLKRYSMIGDGLSHVAFCVMSVALAMNAAPLLLSVPVVTLTAILLLRISDNAKIKGDAMIAIISSSSLAIGVIVTALTTGLSLDVCNYMFGSILAMSMAEVYFSVILSAVVLVVFAAFYNRIFLTTFDENFAKAIGVRVGLYKTMIAVLTAVTIVLGMRMMGALLISSLVIFPALTAMRVFKSFRGVSVCALVVSVTCFFLGIVAAFALALPAGASIVMANLLMFLLFWTFNLIRGGGFSR